ncbi:MAG TPA: hypothetical protein VG498_03405 [Terriglobales bacterium]|nr:hypothetical protein [Terriglobales bacterium]
MVTTEAVVHENVVPEVIKRGSFELRQDLLGRDYKGKSSKGIAKKTSALIQKLQPTLTKFLDPGEQVLYIARVQRHASGLIQYTMGWYIYYASATVIVLTDRRLLHLRVTNSNQWDKGVRTCWWSELESATVGGWALGRVLKLKFRNGTKYRYWRISRADALNIGRILPQLLKTHQGTPYKGQSLVSLCPECKRELAPATSSCSGCGLAFKVKKTMYWLSLVPSAAYIYTRRWFLAFGDFIAQSYAYIVLAIAVYAFLGAALGWKDAAGRSMSVNDGVGVLLFGVFIFVLDLVVTIHHNNYFIEDFIPTDKRADPAESVNRYVAGGTIG